MQRKPPPLHVRLLNMLGAIRGMAPFDLLTADEEWLLGALAVDWHERGTVTVGDLMRSGRHGSHSTAYRRVIALRDKGMVCLRVDPRDKRVKFVEPTELARHYMDSLGSCLRALVPGCSPA